VRKFFYGIIALPCPWLGLVLNLSSIQLRETGVFPDPVACIENANSQQALERETQVRRRMANRAKDTHRDYSRRRIPRTSIERPSISVAFPLFNTNFMGLFA
jgi:hypothetical protein